MSKFVEIESKIKSLGPGEYQRLCSTYIKKKYKFNNMHDIGSKEGTNKTTKGIPDSYSVDSEGKFTLIMYGTVESNSIGKLKKDIKDTVNSKKTGIKETQIKEIICFHTNTNIKPGDYEGLINLIPNIKVTLIDIDTMSHDLEENYCGIVNDYLRIPISSNQISDIDDFIENYDKKSLNSPLQIEFVYRKDLDEIYKTILENKMTLISGKPGIGKTKISLEAVKRLVKEENYLPLCIRINGLELYEELKVSLEHDKKYIIFIDDINNLNGIKSIIDLIVTNKNTNIKILATVRDYLLNDVQKKLNQDIEPKIYELNNMEDSDIIDILEKNYNVRNRDWQQKILKISNGNPRLAIMSFLAVKNSKIESLNCVLDVFKNYYSNIFEEKALSTLEEKILFYIALLSPISTSNKEVTNILDELGINDIEKFKKLRDLELIDFYNDDALKVCDQNFSNYFIFKYLIEDKKIKISDLLKTLYPKFIVKFITAINMINEQFNNSTITDYISSEINIVWNEDIYSNDWDFVEHFHIINIPKSLTIINKKIDDLIDEEIPNNIRYNSNVYLNDNIVSLLSDFKNTDYAKESFELLLKYLKKKPGLYNEICKGIKDYWLVKDTYLDFKLETSIINLLFDSYKKEENKGIKIIYKILLEHSLTYCLELSFNFSKQGNNIRTINLITFKLPNNELVYNFRNNLFDVILNLCSEDDSNYNILLNDSNWFYDEEQKEILKNDIKYLDDNYFKKWNNISLLQSKLLYKLYNKCKKFKLEVTNSLYRFKECKELIILNMFEYYNFDKINAKLIKFLKTQKIISYTEVFKILNDIEINNIKVDDWKIQNSIRTIFDYFVEKSIKSFEEIFKLYLDANCPYVNSMIISKKLLTKELISLMIDKVLESNSSKKYFMLSYLFDEFCDKRYLSLIKKFIKNQSSEIKYTVSINTIMEYSKFDKILLEDYTKEIISLDSLNLYVGYTKLFAEKKFAERLYNSFENKKILEELYLKTIKYHGDYEGNLGYILCINNSDFLNELITENLYNTGGNIKNIISRIWNSDNYDKYISHTFEQIVKSNIGYLRLNILFETDENEKIKMNQINWFKNQINKYNKDKEKIYNLFYSICEKNNDIKLELILFLLDNTSDIEIFKKVNFFSHSASWSGSRVPIEETKIEFISMLLNEIKEKNKLTYIEHINYLNDIINDLYKKIKAIKIEEYIDDLFS